MISSYLKSEFMVNRIDKYEVYFRSFKKFEPRIKEVLFVEERLADHELGVCGQPDLVFIDIDDMVALCDWKTAKNKYKYSPIQLGGYTRLLQRQRDIWPEKCLIVRLRDEDDKKPLITVYDVHECCRLFDNALEIYKLFN
jgi:hypothetical protein